MPLFRYDAFDCNGKRARGVLEASSLLAAKESVRSRNLIPITLALVQPQSQDRPWSFLFERPVDAKNKILFTKQLSVLLGSNVPLLSAVDLLSGHFTGRLRRILIEIKDGLGGGDSLATCLSRYPRVFSGVYVQLVRAGESSGRLDAVLERLVIYLERSEETRKRVRKALSYPVFMLIFGTLVLGVMLVFVVPSITRLFSQTGAQLPLPTQMLVGLSAFLSQSALTLLFVAGFLIGVLGYWRSTQRGKTVIDMIKLRLPLVSHVAKLRVVVQFSQTLGMLLDSGVHLAEALDIVCNIIDNTALIQTLKGARDKIIKEGRITQYLRETEIFPPIATYMISTGEESGNLAQMLLVVGRDYDTELTDTIDGLVRKVNPLMMLVLGGLVFFIVVSIFLPMIQVGDVLGL